MNDRATHDDEQQIRDLVASWTDATRSGDTAALLDLMTDDVMFLVAGQAPFGKSVFLNAAEQLRTAGISLDNRSEILEINVAGDLAVMVARLDVTATRAGAGATRRSGHTLTVFARQDGRWRIHRDANLLVAGRPG